MNETPVKKNQYVDNKKLYESLCGWLLERKTALRKKEPIPRLPEYVGECILLMAQRLSCKVNFCGYCIDETTEALTKRGWLNYKQITTDDIILSCDPADLQLKWSPIHDIYRAPYDGMMFHLTGNGLDALVTPNHKFLTLERGLVKVQYLHQREHIVLMGKPVAAPTEKTYSDAFVELVGWAVTEGCYRFGKRKHSVTITQKKPAGIEWIKRVLEESGAHWTCHVRGDRLTKVGNEKGIHNFHITGPIANKIIEVAPTKRKVLTQAFIDSLTHEQRLLLIDAMLAGDGHTYERETGTTARFYYQKDKAHTDAFVSLCTQAGIRTTITLRKLNTPLGYTETYFVTLCENSGNACYVEKVDFHGSQRDLTHADHLRGELHKGAKLTAEKVLEARALNSAGVSYKVLAAGYGVNTAVLHRACTGQSWKHVTGYESLVKQHEASTPYKGVVWCPTTDYGVMVCRRNGKVFTLPQSYRDDMIGDSMESCLRYIHNFNPEKSTNAFAYITQILNNAFVRRIQRERRNSYTKAMLIIQGGLTGYDTQAGDDGDYTNTFVGFMQENVSDVIEKFEDAKKRKKERQAKKHGIEDLFVAETEQVAAKTV